MSTANFNADKNGIFMVKDYEGDDEGLAIEDALGNIASFLEEHGCTCYWKGNDMGVLFREKQTGKVMAKLWAENGYYSDSQIILRTGLDLYHESLDNGDGQSYDFDHDRPLPMYEAGFSRKYATVKKALKLFTTPLTVVGVFSNGEAIYQN